MSRRVVGGVVIGVGVVAAVAVLVWASAGGWLSPQAGARRLLARAERASAQGEWPQAQASLEELITQYPDSRWTDRALLALGGVYEQQGQLLEARAVYRALLKQFPDSPLLRQAQAQLGAVNVAILFSPRVRDQDATYEVKPGDTLSRIAAAHHTTVSLLRQTNDLRGDVIRPKQLLKVPHGNFQIVVDKSQNQLLLTEADEFFKLYPVATGTDNSTPVGTFRIVNKIPRPVWYRQGAVVPADSPENILGSWWLGLDKQGYGIHGSLHGQGIGEQVTAGCVRMHNTDVEELAAIVPTGTAVTIVD